MPKIMRSLITVFLLFASGIAYSQTHYYTTNGTDRLTEAELNLELSKMENRMTKALGKAMYSSFTIQSTETKNDSIISQVSFKISDKKVGELENSDPLSRYINKVLPGLSLKSLTGESVRLDELKGKPTMINFWFTTCAPCIDEMPALNKIAEKYKGDVNFIAITFESDTEVETFLKKHPFHFEHLINGQDLIDSLGISSFPRNLFLDKSGILKYVADGISYESSDDGELKMGAGEKLIEIIDKLK